MWSWPQSAGVFGSSFKPLPSTVGDDYRRHIEIVFHLNTRTVGFASWKHGYLNYVCQDE